MRTKSEAKRQSIIDTARAIFSERGFADTSMSEIAASVGGSKATLYNYFSSKEELFCEIIHQFAATHMNEIYQQLDAKADVRESLNKFGAGSVKVLCCPEVIAMRANLFLERDKSNVGPLFYERGPLQGLNRLAEYFNQCIALGRLREADPFTMAQQFMALLKAEGEEKIMCGVCATFSDQQIQIMTARAVDVFLRAYWADARAQ